MDFATTTTEVTMARLSSAVANAREKERKNLGACVVVYMETSFTEISHTHAIRSILFPIFSTCNGKIAR